ncbi:hypothetical protein RE628_07750 [Paenibacillus sp. D2_2]|uniref:hypothetical protein n=1 Tax=Paenibacillus sp. D2_2 TaxID=3073092 RepID=UPI0028159E0E|nr:hypothetical protein [Paenibacillus sp. D2_2]WMT42285.1 hypothetical protein RE628_07750 [Paenibacillus sp. D2_2]
MERISLLAGAELIDKIVRINLSDKERFREEITGGEFLLFDVNYAALYFVESSNIKKYSLVLDKNILLSMLKPGAGQSFFDNLILDIKNAIRNN